MSDLPSPVSAEDQVVWKRFYSAVKLMDAHKAKASELSGTQYALAQRHVAKIYGLYKQAMFGDCDAESSLLGFITNPKLHAWQSVKGLTQTEAADQYAKVAMEYHREVSNSQSDN